MILITGATSGIGEATAIAFAAAQRPLVLVARREEKLKTLKATLSEKYGVRVEIARLDVSKAKDVEVFAAKHSSLLSEVTVLVNNAGMAKGLEPIQEGKTENWDEMIDTNLKGLLYVTRALLPHFVKKADGHVVNVGSIAGRWIYPKGNIYCATKAAVAALTEAMRLDLHGAGVRVTNISPGMVETEFSNVRFEGDLERAKAVYRGVDVLTSEDIADAIVWSTTRPKRVNIQEMVIYPTDQASPALVIRK